MTMMTERTAEEIQDLKSQWALDPVWDIEETEGYEAHREELQDYRLGVERDARERRSRELEEKAERLGIPGNTALAAHIEQLEDRLERVERLGD